MKRYLTFIFVLCGIFSIIIGFQFDVRWNGIISWGLATIFLIIAAYFTRHIPNGNKKESNNNLNQYEEEQS